MSSVSLHTLSPLSLRYSIYSVRRNPQTWNSLRDIPPWSAYRPAWSPPPLSAAASLAWQKLRETHTGRRADGCTQWVQIPQPPPAAAPPKNDLIRRVDSDPAVIIRLLSEYFISFLWPGKLTSRRNSNDLIIFKMNPPTRADGQAPQPMGRVGVFVVTSGRGGVCGAGQWERKCYAVVC